VALATHPIVGGEGGYRDNPFYDGCVQALQVADPVAVTAKLETLGFATDAQSRSRSRSK